MADHMRSELVLDALGMAVAARGGVAPGVIAHADRGSQYTSKAYLDYCQSHQLRASVGRTGVCWDNSVAESFWENNAIARRLFVSDRTIEAHIRHVLTKLDIPDHGDTHRRVLAVLTHIRAATP